MVKQLESMIFKSPFQLNHSILLYFIPLSTLLFYISSSEGMHTTTACIQSTVLKQLVSREWDTLQQWQLTYSFEEAPEGCSLSQSFPDFYLGLLVFIYQNTVFIKELSALFFLILFFSVDDFLLCALLNVMLACA